MTKHVTVSLTRLELDALHSAALLAFATMEDGGPEVIGWGERTAQALVRAHRKLVQAEGQR